MKKNRSRTRSSMNVVTSCISTTMVLFLLGSIVFFVTMARNLSDSIRENFTVSLMLADEVTQPQIDTLRASLAQLPCSREVVYISKEQACREQMAALNLDTLDFVDNPVPASLEVLLVADYAETDSLKDVVAQLEKSPLILEASYPSNLMDNLNRNISRVSLVLLIIAALLAVVSFTLINNTIRLWVQARRFLIHTMTLVGASWGFIRKPFLLKALLIGLVSALLASVALMVCFILMVDYEPNMRPLLTNNVMAATFGVVFACGTALTLLCAYVSVNGSLRMSYDKLHRY